MILNSSIFYSFSCKTVALRQAYYLNSRFEIFYQPTRTTYLGHVKASDNELVVDSFPINQSFRVGRSLLIPSDPLSIENIYHNLGLPAFIFIDWLIRLETIFMFFLFTFTISMMASLFDNFLKPTSLKPSSVFSEETMYEENISKRILKSVELVPFQLLEEFKK